jgi:hypothetical protein
MDLSYVLPIILQQSLLLKPLYEATVSNLIFQPNLHGLKSLSKQLKLVTPKTMSMLCLSNELILFTNLSFPVQTLCFVTNLPVLSLSMIIRYHCVYEFLSVVAITTLTSLFQSKDVLL